MRHCCLCGLLCSLDRVASSTCPRRTQWIERSAANLAANPAANIRSATTTPLRARIDTIADQFRASRRPLMWIDSADVHTLRCAVALAEAVRGTIHIGQSTGAIASHRVLTSQGWLGSSLAEVASHADLIISLGSGLHTEAPLLAPRFFAPALIGDRAQWWHIASRDSASPASPWRDLSSHASTCTDHRPLSPNWTAVWPRADWYAQLTHIMLGLQDDSARADAVAGQLHESTRQLLDRLRSAKNTVWLWDVDEFRDAIDELCIQRLLGISRLLSQTARCGLIGLDAQVGRVTALETLLWLTGCSGTAQFDGQHWSQPHGLAELAMEQWPTVFDAIMVVRSLPSVYPLPSLPAGQFLVPQQSLLPDHIGPEKVTAVASVGVDCDGHVMRGDRATLLYCLADVAEVADVAGGAGGAVADRADRADALPGTATAELPTAGEVLQHIHRRVLAGGQIDAH